jgi:predicted ATPase with chaperone activity
MESLEILRHDYQDFHNRALVEWQARFRGVLRGSPYKAGHGKKHSCRCAADTRRQSYLTDKLLKKRVGLLVRVIAREWQGDAQGEEVRRVEPEIQAAKMRHAFDQQRRANQQNDGKCYLSDDQQAAGAKAGEN